MALPEEADNLRRKHDHPSSAEELQIEVVVHGSERHSALLHETRRHHEARRDALRERHGSAVLEEWDTVRGQLDGVTAELERLVDHSGALRENFTKFGYAAQLRIYGEGESLSRAGSAREVGSISGGEDWNDRSGVAVSLFKTPVVKQYFHRGLLWRSSERSEIGP